MTKQLLGLVLLISLMTICSLFSIGHFFDFILYKQRNDLEMGLMWGIDFVGLYTLAVSKKG